MNPDVDTSFLPDRERDEADAKLRWASTKLLLTFGFIVGIYIADGWVNM